MLDPDRGTASHIRAAQAAVPATKNCHRVVADGAEAAFVWVFFLELKSDCSKRQGCA